MKKAKYFHSFDSKPTSVLPPEKTDCLSANPSYDPRPKNNNFVLLQNNFAWTFTIGDPSFMGWLIVAAYFFATSISFMVFNKAKDLFPYRTLQKQKIFWLTITIIMLALGINKQMDLQSLLTAVARYFAKEQGWYEQRRQFQLLFIKSVLASATLTIVFLIWYMRDALKNNALAICGICFLAAFIAIRASSFHHVDIFINTTVLNVRFNWIMELSGIFLVILSAKSNLRTINP